MDRTTREELLILMQLADYTSERLVESVEELLAENVGLQRELEVLRERIAELED